MRPRTLSWLLVATGLMAALLVLGAWFTLQRAGDLRQHSEQVAHTQEVIAAVEGLWSIVQGAEAGQRGYIITGEDHYLGPYRRALVTLHDSAANVRELISDNSDQLARFDKLERLINERFVEMERVAVLRRDEGFEAARERMLTDAGRLIMSDLRFAIDEIQDEEEALLAIRTESNNTAYNMAIYTVLADLAGSLAALLAFAWLLRRHFSSLVNAANSIHEKNELLQATLISIGDGVIITDREGKITMLNEVAQRLTGWKQVEAAGMPLEGVFRIVNEGTRAVVENPALRAIREGRIVGLANHTILIGKHGQEWPIDDSAAPIRSHGGTIRGAVLVFREIVERKRQEAELQRQSKALSDADQRKNEFLATLAHELRNPLAPLSNALQLWPLIEHSVAEVEQIRGVMQRQVGQMKRLIDDLMDVSRITSGKFQLQWQQVELHSLIESAIESVQPTLTSRNQKLTVSSSDRPILIMADVARLTQVFGNILHNASKYTGVGAQIWVAEQAADGMAQVRIRDNGAGIPREMLSEIFEMFRQVDSTLERAEGGLGIGLTLVKRIIEAHGGKVRAESEGPGKGSEFVISLPIVAGTTEPLAPTRARPAQLTNDSLNVLVVDDVEASATTLSMMLRGMGHHATAAHDGLSALACIQAQRPDVVIMDIAMPGMSGYEVARKIREQDELRRMYLIALTGYGQESDRQRAIDAGFDQHVIKPIHIDVLRQALQTASLQPSQRTG